MILIYIIIYLVGCTLAYGRIVASFYEIEEAFPRLKPELVALRVLCIISWFAFLVGICIYFLNREKYFFKWSIKDLEDIYNKSH